MTRQRSQSLLRALYRDATRPYRGASTAKLRRLCAEIVAEGRRPSPLAVFAVDGDAAIETLMAAGLPVADADDLAVAGSGPWVWPQSVQTHIAELRAASGEASRLLGMLLDGGTGEFPPIRSPVVRAWATVTAAEHVDAPWAMRLLAALGADDLPERMPPGAGTGLPRVDGPINPQTRG